MKTRNRKPWRKILFEEQDYPDNYCGPEFLDELKRNVTAETYTYWESVRGSCVLMQQLSSLLLYVVVFALLYMNYINWSHLLICSLITCALIYALLICFNGNVSKELLLNDCKTLAVFVCFGYGLSPVLKTLTESISTDTIYAMTTLMFLLSLVFYDYGVDVAIVSKSMSLNACLFGAVCLISRLPSANEGFTLLAICVELFVLWPMLSAKLSAKYRSADICITATQAVLVLLGFVLISPVSAILYVVLHAFISLVCPAWLISMQPIKSTIHGPWDEAVIGDK